ncbi:MAG: YdbH domain-containing protein [Pseudohongiellaceae bacterium]
MSRIFKAAILLLLLVSIPLGLVLFRPGLVLGSLLRSSADQLGYEIVSMQVSQLGARSMTLAQLSLSSVDLQLDFTNLIVRYSPTGLLAGRVESVQIAETTVRSNSNSDQTTDSDQMAPAEILATFDDLGIGTLSLRQLILVDAENGIEAQLSVQSPPLQIQGSAQLKALPDFVLEFVLERTGASDFDIASSARLLDESIFISSIQLKAIRNEVSLSGTSTVFLNPLREQLYQLLPTSTVISNDSLSLQSAFDIEDLFGEASISNINLVFQSPDSMLHISQESDLGASEMQLRLPIRLQGDIATRTGEMQLTLGEVYGSGNWSLADANFSADSSFTDIQLHCTSFTSCDIRSEWQSNVTQWRFGDYVGDKLGVTAALRFNYSNDEMRLASELVQIRLPSLKSESDPAMLDLATTLQLDALEFRVGDVISGGFNFNSSDLNLENYLIDLENPAYSGKLQLEDDVLTGILELDLDQRLRLGIGLQHFFLRDTGDVVLQLAALEFSEAEPLSSLLTVKGLEADLLAGQIEGYANISWSKQTDDSWRFGGPIALGLDRLSGYYTDYFFVDLSTKLFAEATTPLGMQVTNPSSASLGRIDIGLPLQNLSWQYRFDTLTSAVQLNDFTTEVLGGRLSIPAARYSLTGDRQQIDVVLADIDVATLVGLADYPQLQADGLISGYLPFVLEGNKITIDRGLIGALNPGGSIRYTPESPAPSSNPSLRLVNEALANYQYQIMNTEVYYDEEGELLLNVQLQGRNPNMNDGQAINLNVNISDNIPSLLRSLQASRVITDELERFLARP